MKKNVNDRALRLVLDRMVAQAVPNDLQAWPAIRARIERRQRRPWVLRAAPTTRLGWVILALAVAIVLGAATFAATSLLGHRLFSQVMGRYGQGSPTEQTHEINKSQTLQGITVTADRAYFEDNRIGIEYTVTGLDPQQDPHSYTLRPGLVDAKYSPMSVNDPRVAFPSTGGAGVRAGDQEKGMEVPLGTVKEVASFDITSAQPGADGLHLLFVVWVRNGVSGGGEDFGPFTFEFTVPFTPIRDSSVIEIDQTVQAAGVDVRLERLTVTKAEVQALLWVERTAEQAQAGMGPRNPIMLMPAAGWSDRTRPHSPAYLIQMLTQPGQFLAHYHNNDSLEFKPGEWVLTVPTLGGAEGEPVQGPWVFRFTVP